MPDRQSLRYGNNPHQSKASFIAPSGAMETLNGEPSYINLLDILTGWQMTRDLWAMTNNVAAVSMKHCVPVGLAVPGEIDNFSSALLRVDDAEPTTSAYLRARSSDWAAAYGDVIVVFGEVGEELANLLTRLVSDGIAATGFTDEAIRILSRKKNGNYLMVKLDQGYAPPDEEARDVFGVQLIQQRNSYLPSNDDFKVVVGSAKLAKKSTLDLMLSAVVMKYTVSNNMVVSSGGRTLAVSAGQQSRILSTNIACQKFEQYKRLQNKAITDAVRSDDGKLTEKVLKAVTKTGDIDAAQFKSNTPVVLSSDGFIPFKDNLEIAAKCGIQIVCEPGGALRSREIEEEAEKWGMTLVRTEHRYFYH